MPTFPWLAGGMNTCRLSGRTLILYLGFGSLLFITFLCLPLLGKMHNLMQSLVESEELLNYSWQHLSHSNPMD